MGNVLLKIEDRREFTLVLLAPDVTIVARIHQLYTHGKIVATLRHSARQYAPDSQRLCDLFGIDVLAFIAKYGTARHHFEFRDLGKIIDQAVGDTVGEVLHIRAAPGIHERQHGNRCDSFPAIARAALPGAAVPQYQHRGGRDYKRERQRPSKHGLVRSEPPPWLVGLLRGLALMFPKRSGIVVRLDGITHERSTGDVRRLIL